MTFDAWQAIELFGPWVLGGIGTALTAAFGLAMAIGRWAWAAHQRRMEAMAGAIDALAKAVTLAKEGGEAEAQRLRDGLQGVRAEVALGQRHTQDALARVLELGGMVKLQQETLEKHARATERISGKLEAIFRFIDAPRRPTDATGSGG